MASPVSRGAPRPRYDQQPSPKYKPNFQSNPNVLADNVQNLNLNHPPAMPNSGSRPSPGFPVASPPRPYPPGPTLWSTGKPTSGSQPSLLPPNVAPGRPTGPPGSQPSPPFASRPPPPGSMPSSMRGPVVPLGGFPSSGSPSGPTVPPPPGVRPSPFASSSPLSSGPIVDTLSVPPKGAVSSGMPFASGAMAGGPRFPPVSSAPQPLMGSPPIVPAPAPPQAPPVSPVQSRPPFSAGGPGVPPSFLAGAQVVPPPPGPPFGAQTWSLQPQQPPTMFGMPPHLANQGMMAISPAMGQNGASLAGQPKMDSKSVPRPTPTSESIHHETRLNNQANPPPPASSEYIARDSGNCSTRYMRCTINQIPCTADLLNTSAMQLALSVQPLALPHPSEEPIQVVDFGESGPLRCSRCRGYINPFMKFIDHGRRFICNFCGFADETPRDYQCNLGPDGRRRDADERPELCRGTVEFVASKEYMVREPMPAVYFFLIDVSMNAIQTGATAAACNAINQVISNLQEGPRTKVGVATFDSTIHFYNLKRALQQPLMLIVPDVEDVYTPLQTDVVVHLSECRENLELLLENIPSMFQDNGIAESAFGAAIKAAFLAIKCTGGKLLVFLSVLPSLGIGSLSSRDAEGKTNISAGDKEAHKLLQPADITLKTMAIEFAEYQVCIDVFITTQTYVDIASISVIPRTTGGQVYYYYPFSALSDPAKLSNDLRWNVTRPQGFEAVMRVRCSQGIQVQEYSGNFCKHIPTDIDLPGIDCDKTIMATLKHDGKLQDGSECAFQCALVYTTLYGQRRIRVITLSLPCVNMISDLFRSVDLETQFAYFLKQAASEIPSRSLSNVREQVINLCINILLSYRKFCATVLSSGQLILPEALKLLPLYTLALIKSTGLRSDGRIDDRSFWISHVSSLSTALVVPLVYPRMVAIHDLNSKEGEESLIPPVIALSGEHVRDEGIYFLENGDEGLICVGNSMDSNILQQLFGISSVDEIPTQFVLQQLNNPLSKKLNDVINEIRRQRCSYLRLKLCKKGDPSGMFFTQMVEDKNHPIWIFLYRSVCKSKTKWHDFSTFLQFSLQAVLALPFGYIPEGHCKRGESDD